MDGIIIIGTNELGKPVYGRHCFRCGKLLTGPLSRLKRGVRMFCNLVCRGSGKDVVPINDRFWRHVNKCGPVIRPELGPCWEWTAARLPGGYGQFGAREAKFGRRTVGAHRIAFCLAHGHGLDDIAGSCVMHKCDNPPCCNPAHLELGTLQENNADMARKGRSTRGERNPMARLTAESVRAIRAAYAAGERTVVIAARFGVTDSNVYQIARRRIWRHV